METRLKQKTIDKDLQSIKFNAFNLAPILMSFFNDCRVKKDSVLLAYLIFPILFSNEWKKMNVIIRKDSKLEKWALDNRMPLNGLNERINFFEKYTTAALQYCFDLNWGIIDDNNNVKVTKNGSWKNGATPVMIKAMKLNSLFNDMTVSRIYSTLGIFKLCLHESNL